MTTRSVSIQRGSSDTDESSPNRCKNGTDQQVEWIVAKRGAVSAHLGAQAADLIMAGCIEQAGQDNQNRSDEVHRLLPLGPSIGSSLSALLAGATNPARATACQIQLGLVQSRGIKAHAKLTAVGISSSDGQLQNGPPNVQS
jgi:hypothetical protein